MFPVLFLSFLQCFLHGLLWKEETYIYIYIYIYTGEDWGSGFTFIYLLRFLILFLSLTAGNWDYLY